MNILVGIIAAFFLSATYIYPIFRGLILLPLDLLVSNSAPWYLANQILIKNPYMLDSVVQMFPWHHLTYISLRSFSIPLWNPYQFTGMPFMASMKPMVFYPLNILNVFPEVYAWNLLLLMQLVLAFFFFFLFIRKIGASYAGAFLSAISFAFSSLMVGFLQFGSDGHTLVWLPFILYCVYSFTQKRHIRYLLGISIGVMCAIFAGHLQMVAYESILIAAFSIFLFIKKDMSINDFFMVFLYGVIGVGLASIQLIPSIELFSYSYRSTSDGVRMFLEGLIKPYELLRLFAPDLFGNPVTKDLNIGYIETSGYIGSIPLFFSFYGSSFSKKNPFVVFFAMSAFISALFSLQPFGQVISFFRIPLLSSGSGGRLFFLTLFSLSVLAGFGFDAFLEKSRHSRKPFMYMLAYITLSFIIVIGAYVFNSKHFIGATFANIKFPIIVLSGFFCISAAFYFMKDRIRIAKVGFIVAILAISYIDVFRMGYRFLTFSNTKFLYPEIDVISFVKNKSNRTFGRVYGLAGSEVPTALGIRSVETYNPLYPQYTGKLLKALERKDTNTLPTNVFMFNPSRELKYVLDVLGVDIIVIENDQDPAAKYFTSTEFQTGLNPIYKDERHDVYQNASAHPRFGLFYKYNVISSDDSMLMDIRERKTNLRDTLLLSAPVEADIREGTGSAALLSSTLNSVSFSIETDAPALFYLSDVFFPGWIVRVNSKTTPLLRANYAFRAVAVPEGKSNVEFSYEPTSFINGKLLTLVSCIGLFVLTILSLIYNCIFLKRDKQKHPQDANQGKPKPKRK